MMTNLAPPQIRAITGLELAAGVFTKCSDGLATQLNISLTSGKRDPGPTEFRIGINGDVYGGMLAPIEVGKRRVDIAYVNPSAMVAMAYRGKGYYKQKMALRILGCFPSWDRIALVVSKDLAVKSLRDIARAKNSAERIDEILRRQQRNLLHHRDDSFVLRNLVRQDPALGWKSTGMPTAGRAAAAQRDRRAFAYRDIR